MSKPNLGEYMSPEPEPNWRSAYYDMREERNTWMKRAIRAEEKSCKLEEHILELNEQIDVISGSLEG
jgi:hypothetical protein